MYQAYRYISITILVILLVGCGGSGGNSASDYTTDISSSSGTSDYNIDTSSINNDVAKNITAVKSWREFRMSSRLLYG